MRDVVIGKTALVEKTEKLRGKAIVEGGASTATRTMGLLGGILSFAVSEGVLSVNPVHGVKRPADQRKTLRLDPKEYRRLGTSLEKMAANGGNEAAITAVRMMLSLGNMSLPRWMTRSAGFGVHRPNHP